MPVLNISTEEFQLLGDLIRQECGIHLQEDKKYLIESRLASLVFEHGCDSFHAFYLKARSNLQNGLKEKIVDAMTTNETLWFRDESPFTVLREKLFPRYEQELSTGKRSAVRIWSAACSTGQEPYSIAMTAHESSRSTLGKSSLLEHLNILGTDISPSVLTVAKMCRYNVLAMSRGMPEGFQDRYFTQQGPIWCLNEDVKKLVSFQQFNLQSPFTSLGRFDIVFLRNVAIYFSAEFKTDLYKKIAAALNPGGYLFIGASESLIGYTNDFQLVEDGRCLYYQLKQA